MLELLVSSLSLVVMCGERLLRYKSLPDSVRVLTLQTIDPARLLGPAIETIR